MQQIRDVFPDKERPEACILLAVSYDCRYAGSVWLPAALFTAAYALTHIVCLQLIREKGLTKLTGRAAEHNIDAAEADVIWAVHKATETRLELRSLVYKASRLYSQKAFLLLICSESPVITLGQIPAHTSRLAGAAILHVGYMH